MTAVLSKDQERSVELIEKQIEDQRIPTDADVTELYLGRYKLCQIVSLDRFRNLHVLWLNGNRLRTLEFLRPIERLAELHLEDNLLARFGDSLKHLTGLRILTLQKNQLVNLELVVKKLIHMQSLERLSLAHTPVSQETDYRHYVIYHIPSLQTLDREEVSLVEKLTARKIYDQNGELVRQRFAFGTKKIENTSTDIIDPDVPQPKKNKINAEIGNNFFRENPPFETNDEAIESRRLKKSVMELTRLDWSQVPRYAQRRQSSSFADKPMQDQSSAELISLRIKS